MTQYNLVHNPTTITSPVSSVYGHYLAPPSAWRLTNLSAIDGGNTGTGILLEASGTIANGSSGNHTTTIDGTKYGIDIDDGDAKITNFGSITGGKAVFVHFGSGTFVNGSTTDTTALIAGKSAGIELPFSSSANTVQNFGTISASTGVAVSMGYGTVTNGTSTVTHATISGHTNGISSTAEFATTVTNFGHVTGGTGAGVTLYNGLVSNGSAAHKTASITGGTVGVAIHGEEGVQVYNVVTNFGTISGKTGITLAQGTVTNAGTIIGTGGTAVSFGKYSDRVVVNGGARFVDGSGGTATVNGGAGTDIIELAGTVSDTLAFGSQFIGFEQVAIDTGAKWRVDVNQTSLAGKTIAGAGIGDVLGFTEAGTFDLAHASGFPTIDITTTGTIALTFHNASFAKVTGGAITMNLAAGTETIDASAVTTTADHLIVHAGSGTDHLTGGAGNDVFYADGKTTMTGKGGTNEFVFKTTGTANTIADFSSSAKNEIVFSNAGFNLGLSGASSTPKALPSSLFVANSAGIFTNATQRFAYDTTNGELFYDADGHGTSSARHSVVTLTGHPTLTASHLFFVS